MLFYFILYCLVFGLNLKNTEVNRAYSFNLCLYQRKLSVIVLSGNNDKPILIDTKYHFLSTW